MGKRIDWTEEQINFMIEQYTSQKMNTVQLGKYFNCSCMTIINQLKKHNIVVKRFSKDLSGQKFHLLMILSFFEKRQGKNYWKYLCDCGNITIVETSALTSGRTKSCGCLRSGGGPIVFSDEQKCYIIENYENHKKSAGQLANEFGCSIDTIHRRLTEWGCDTTRKGHHFPFEDLTGKTYGELLVLHLNQKRYDEEVKKTNKPHKYWTCLCSCGRIKDVESSHLKNGHTTSCGHIRSKGEQKITDILQYNNILFTSEKSFKDLRGYGNGLLRYDFEILQNGKTSYLIEFNGEQHYRCKGGWDTEEEFKIRKFNDDKKIKYCQEKNIPLIIIPYTQLDKFCLEDLLLEVSQFRKV